MHLWVQIARPCSTAAANSTEARIGRRCGSKILAPSDGISQNSPKADLRQTANTLSYLTDGPESRIMAGTEISAFFRVGLRSVWWNKIVNDLSAPADSAESHRGWILLARQPGTPRLRQHLRWRIAAYARPLRLEMAVDAPDRD
jgi:hypothetical protein